MSLKAEVVMDGLVELRWTVSRLHDPDIIQVDIQDMYGMPRVFLHCPEDPTEVIRDIGLGLIDVEDAWDPAWNRFSVTDINGVEVFWICPKTENAPDAATSGANEGDADGDSSISPDEDEVKEVRYESEN